MDPQSCVIGLDIGTTSVKAAAFDSAGRQLALTAETLEQQRTESGAAEQDPHVVYAAVMATLVRVAAQVRQLGYRADQIGLSAAMHSLIPVGADDQPLAPAMLWMDTRAGDAADALWATPAGRDVYARTGTPIHAMAPLAKLLWMRAQRSEQFAAAARFVSLKEWVWYQWFAAWQIDTSLASATGLYNLRQGSWDAEALDIAGIGPERLSALVPTTYVRHGLRDAQLLAAGLTLDTQWAIGASDGVLANLGVGAIGSDLLVMTIGTSLAVRTGAPTPLTDPATRPFCYVLDQDRYIVGGPSNSGGGVLDWLYRHILGGPAAHAEGPTFHTLADLIAAAGEVESEGLVCLPYAAGERAPLWNAHARGALFGLTLSHSRVHVMRAAIEGIIFNAYWIAARLFEQQGRPRELIASGKVLEETWIRQLVADVFDLPVRSSGETDASVTGAAWLANLAAGVWSWEDVARRAQLAHGPVTMPRDHARAQEAYQRFQRLYQALAAEMSER
ncbi:MAG TPA: gluconokinase [Ktedonobacterales bacterium]